MFVCFAVELKIGFQVGLVVAKLAQVVASNNHRHLIFPRVTSVLRQVVGEVIQVVTAIDPADTASINTFRILISRLWWGFMWLVLSIDGNEGW